MTYHVHPASGGRSNGALMRADVHGNTGIPRRPKGRVLEPMRTRRSGGARVVLVRFCLPDVVPVGVDRHSQVALAEGGVL